MVTQVDGLVITSKYDYKYDSTSTIYTLDKAKVILAESGYIVSYSGDSDILKDVLLYIDSDEYTRSIYTESPSWLESFNRLVVLFESLNNRLLCIKYTPSVISVKSVRKGSIPDGYTQVDHVPFERLELTRADVSVQMGREYSRSKRAIA